MSVFFFGNGPISITGTAQSLTTLLGITDPARRFFGHGAIRAAAANAGNIYIGKSNVTVGANQLGYLRAGEAFEIALEGVYTCTDELYLIAGTPGDTVYICFAS